MLKGIIHIIYIFIIFILFHNILDIIWVITFNFITVLVYVFCFGHDFLGPGYDFF